MSDPDLYGARSYEEFWPLYLRAHGKAWTRRLHFVGTSTALTLGALALASRRPLLLLLIPPVDYAIAQSAHRLVEGNRTQPLRRPLWHARAELQMWARTLMGR